MSSSPYVRAIRAKIGHDLLMLQSVTVILFDDDRLLLAQNGDTGLWMTIGGAIDPDEAPADAAVREFWEETGLLIEPTALLGVFGGPEFRITYPNGDHTSYMATVFLGLRIGGELRPDGSEAVALRFVTRAEAAGLPMTPFTGAIVAQAFDYVGTPYFARPRWQPPSSLK
jgi:8-oxo-dGTP pyrophosphatase MutT (NUDIX family)